LVHVGADLQQAKILAGQHLLAQLEALLCHGLGSIAARFNALDHEGRSVLLVGLRVKDFQGVPPLGSLFQGSEDVFSRRTVDDGKAFFAGVFDILEDDLQDDAAAHEQRHERQADQE